MACAGFRTFAMMFQARLSLWYASISRISIVVSRAFDRFRCPFSSRSFLSLGCVALRCVALHVGTDPSPSSSTFLSLGPPSIRWRFRLEGMVDAI